MCASNMQGRCGRQVTRQVLLSMCIYDASPVSLYFHVSFYFSSVDLLWLHLHLRFFVGSRMPTEDWPSPLYENIPGAAVHVLFSKELPSGFAIPQWIQQTSNVPANIYLIFE